MPVPTGRFEKRIARAVTVEIRPEDEGMPKERDADRKRESSRWRAS